MSQCPNYLSTAKTANKILVYEQTEKLFVLFCPNFRLFCEGLVYSSTTFSTIIPLSVTIIIT